MLAESYVAELGDTISKLNLSDIALLCDYLKVNHQINLTIGVTATTVPVKQDNLSLVLYDYVDEMKINNIKIVREISGLGLKEAKDLVERVKERGAQVVRRGLNENLAKDIKRKFDSIESTTEIVVI